MKSFFISGLLITLMAWLSACSQTPPAPAPDYLLPGASHSGHSPLQIRVTLANYLDQGGIVLQLSDTELHVARQHRWAERTGSHPGKPDHTAGTGETGSATEPLSGRAER